MGMKDWLESNSDEATVVIWFVFLFTVMTIGSFFG